MREMSFSPQRAIESMLYLSNRLQRPTIHELLKLRYFADKLHFSAHGFMASGDDYCALEFGPVASNTYDMLKAARGQRGSWIKEDFIRAVDGAIEVSGHDVTPLRAANVGILSRSDIAALDEALERYGNMSFEDRTKLSHDAAYDKAWAAAGAAGMDSGKMTAPDIAGTLENAEELLDYLES